mgnify:FL=1
MVLNRRKFVFLASCDTVLCHLIKKAIGQMDAAMEAALALVSELPDESRDDGSVPVAVNSIAAIRRQRRAEKKRRWVSTERSVGVAMLGVHDIRNLHCRMISL